MDIVGHDLPVMHHLSSYSVCIMLHIGRTRQAMLQKLTKGEKFVLNIASFSFQLPKVQVEHCLFYCNFQLKKGLRTVVCLWKLLYAQM